MKTRALLIIGVICCIMTLFLWNGSEASAIKLDTQGEPGDPVVTGSPNLTKSIHIFPYDTDIFGIYLVDGDQMTPVTSVVVEHINIDTVTAKLSPDSLKVAYLVEYGSTGFSELIIVGIDGLNSSILFESDDPGRHINSFSWAHDSDKVAYALTHDSFTESSDIAESFGDPDLELDPEAATEPDGDPLEYSGEIWITDLYGETQQQLVDRGAMDVLGWTSDDDNILFTRVMTTTFSDIAPATLLTDTRSITPTTQFASAVSLVQTNAITSPVTANILTNTIPISGTNATPLLTDFYLLETSDNQQKLAVVSTALAFETLPITDTMLILMDLENLTSQEKINALTTTTILTNSESIVNVTISPDGANVAYLTENSGSLWLAEVTGMSHTEIITGGLSATSPIVWTESANSLAAASLTENSVQVLDASGTLIGNLSVIPSDDLNVEPLGAQVQKALNAPYIHQVWDTPNWFAGYCACGPTSTAMALAFYGKISPHPITIPVPYSHTNDYGFYVAEKYGSQFQTRWAWDCGSGLQKYKKAYGLYGFTMVNSNYRAAEYARIRDAVHKHGISTTQDWSPTFNEVKAAIDRNHLLIVGTKLTKGGHIVLIKGYTNDGRIIVHDPYGNFRKGSYGQYNGADSWYYWKDLTRYGWGNFNTIEVQGTPPTSEPKITHWKGEYYNNRDLSGSRTLVRNDTNINFNWGGGSPASGISSDNFSVRWTRTMRFDRGVYRFRTTTDDGVRLYVDNKLIINKWYDQGTTAHESGSISLSGGNHTIRMEYYEHGGGATAGLSWKRIGSGSSGSGWNGQYFNNRNLSGSPAFTRNDDSVYFNWRNGSPGAGVGSDNFSVRWTKNLDVPRSGYYKFYTRADDGVRVWVDGRLRINGWRDQGATTYGSQWLYLGKGNHSIKIEYYEHGGGSYIRFWMMPAFYTQFYNNRTLSGSPSWTGYYSRVWFNWGWGGGRNTSSSNFSARWTGSIALSGGRYQFCTRTDDGSRLYVDGQRIINKWQNQAATTHCTTRTLSNGFHEVKMEYYERTGRASAKLWWRKLGSLSSFSDPVQLESNNQLENIMMSNIDSTEEDILALYNDYGYLGPLTEEDVADAQPGLYEIFLPVIIR